MAAKKEGKGKKGEVVSKIDIEKEEKLKKLETEIEDEQSNVKKSVQNVGEKLKTIRDQKLYVRYKNFDSYCVKRWEYSRSYASRLISAYETHTRLLPIGTKSKLLLPTTENQIREVNKVKIDDEKKRTDAQIKIIEHAVKLNGEGKLTAKNLSDARRCFDIDTGEFSKKPDPRPKKNDTAVLSRDHVEITEGGLLCKTDSKRMKQFNKNIAMQLKLGARIQIKILPAKK
jgi:hypothetical protein